MRPEKIKALKLFDLGLTSTTRNNLTEFILEEVRPDVRFEYGKQRLDGLKEWAKIFTAADAINSLDKASIEKCDKPSWRQGNGFYDLRKKLIELGLTQLDWIALPHSTVTSEMLRRLSKKELLQISVLLLGTLSGKALDQIEYKFERSATMVTIQDLLDYSAEKLQHNGWNFRMCIANTRRKLQEIGFHYEDGPFLQEGTKREMVESLMKYDGLSQKTANVVCSIALKRGWVKPFQE